MSQASCEALYMHCFLNRHNPQSAILMNIKQLKKLKPREVKSLAQDHA